MELISGEMPAAAPKVLVLGDLIMDEFVYGECKRISPEAPVPVVLYDRSILVEGGAGNVVQNLKALGAETKFWCSTKHSHKTRIIAGHQQVVRLDKDDTRKIGPPSNLEELIEWCDVVVVSDYNKGVINCDLLMSLEHILYTMKRPLLIDPYNGQVQYGECVTLIKPNRAEAESIAGISIVDHKTLCSAGQIYLERSQSQHVVITLGADGMALFDRGTYWESPYIVNQEVQQVFDVTGAGDTAIAVLAYIWADAGEGKFSKQAAVNWANKAAGIVCSKLGTATVSHAELFGKQK